MFKRDTFDANLLLPIVKDSALATRYFGEGRLIPALIVDCSQRRDILNLVSAHQTLPPGDVKTQWLTDKKKAEIVYLHVMFERPMVLEFFLEFPVVTRGIIVDAILHNKGFYLQPAEMGLHIIQGIEKGIILVEVADTGFLSVWNGLYERKMVEKFRERELSKSEAQKAGKKHLKLVRELWIKRF